MELAAAWEAGTGSVPALATRTRRRRGIAADQRMTCAGALMPYAEKIIVHAPPADPARRGSFVEACLADGGALIAIVGDDADRWKT